ncbi:hypothetical protein EAO73_27370 [Streptomyces sp. col6]|nr:hypothetical protein EAO73_27370 [Streptomyces sp. col6]
MDRDVLARQVAREKAQRRTLGRLPGRLGTAGLGRPPSRGRDEHRPDHGVAGQVRIQCAGDHPGEPAEEGGAGRPDAPRRSSVLGRAFGAGGRVGRGRRACDTPEWASCPSAVRWQPSL